MKQLEIIYESPSFVVINKPAGLAVQGGKGITVSLDSILEKAWSQGHFLVHRLDRDTSGLVLVAKTKTAAAWFSRYLGESKGGILPADRRIVKRYLAVCRGRPASAEGIINLELDIRGRTKKSETRYRLLTAEDQYRSCSITSLLELEPGTGRMHQIRRHLALAGTPVIGDDKYGDFTLNHQLRKSMKLRHLLLHASQLIIPETPEGSAPLNLNAPLPDYFSQFLAQ